MNIYATLLKKVNLYFRLLEVGRYLSSVFLQSMNPLHNLSALTLKEK